MVVSARRMLLPSNCNKFYQQEYVTKYKPLCSWWVQVSIEDASALKDLDFLLFGYHLWEHHGGHFIHQVPGWYWNQFLQEQMQAKDHNNQNWASKCCRPCNQTPSWSDKRPQQSVFVQVPHPWVRLKGQWPLLPKSEGKRLHPVSLCFERTGIWESMNNSFPWYTADRWYAFESAWQNLDFKRDQHKVAI